VQDKIGQVIVQETADAVQGYRDDVALAFANQSGAVGWLNVLEFGRSAGFPPCNATGTITCTLIYAQGHSGTGAFNATNGVDWHLVTFSGNTWNDGHVAFTGTGHIASSGTAPTLSGCGTSPSLGSGATDTKGVVTLGSGTVTACTLTFATAYASAPVVIVSDNSTTIANDISAVSASALTASFSASFPGGHLYYHVIQ
jgi:hypothetical protein